MAGPAGKGCSLLQLVEPVYGVQYAIYGHINFLPPMLGTHGVGRPRRDEQSSQFVEMSQKKKSGSVGSATTTTIYEEGQVVRRRKVPRIKHPDQAFPLPPGWAKSNMQGSR